MDDERSAADWRSIRPRGLSSLSAVRAWLDDGNDVNGTSREIIYDDDGEGDPADTMLHECCQKDYCNNGSESHRLEIARLLISRGADVNAKFGRKSPLHIACFYGNAEMISLLLENGADCNYSTTSRYRDYPLLWLIEAARHRDILEPLISLLRAGTVLEANPPSEAPTPEDSLQYDDRLDLYRNKECLALLKSVRLAGGWKQHCLIPHRHLLALRSLRSRGRALPTASTPPHVDRLLSPNLPSEIVGHVLSYWLEWPKN